MFGSSSAHNEAKLCLNWGRFSARLETQETQFGRGEGGQL